MTSTESLITHCKAYFNNHPPSSWSYSSFAVHLSAANCILKPDAINFRWSKNLSLIANCDSDNVERRTRARVLLNGAKRRRQRIDRSSLPAGNRRRGKRERSAVDGQDGAGEGINCAGSEVKAGLATCIGGDQSIDSINSHNISAHNLSVTFTAAEPADPPAKKKEKEKKTVAPTYESFAAMYQTMAPRTKLQQLLFNAVQAAETNPLLLGWVVDLADSKICKVLGDVVTGMLAAGLVEPERDAELERAAERFFELADEQEARTIAAYRKVEAAFLRTLTYSDEDGYSNDMHFGEVYFKSSISALLSLMQYLPRPQPLMEGWFDCNVWSWVIDQCFWGLKGVTLSRKEIRVLAFPQNRTHCDGIMLSSVDGTSIEFGCVEVAHSGKRTRDESKVVDIMKRMLDRLVELVGGDGAVVPRLCVVGIVCKGWTVRVGRMCVVEGVYVLRWGPVRGVPVTVENIKKVWEVARGMMAVKNVVKECHRAVIEYFEAAVRGDI